MSMDCSKLHKFHIHKFRILTIESAFNKSFMEYIIAIPHMI